MSPILRIGFAENGGGGGGQPAAPKGPPAYIAQRPIEEMTWAEIRALLIPEMALLYRRSKARALLAFAAENSELADDIERMLNPLRHYLAELLVQAVEKGDL